ncbi:hypothetical protein Lesp02_23620 [Lentzea sp. NBRC 105346]|uniref:hypothetical protein n=1 Tax=Lentzea sp. NBRC 105346 TaxID=3032205 RepID=UPI0024A573B0|nr:hypothetical protein [Lentzea sp. NBRC 105346]GLZ30172.1 hypothetical protein Lesp02_23620 [Lentzea sp. NBRC 105346]
MSGVVLAGLRVAVLCGLVVLTTLVLGDGVSRDLVLLLGQLAVEALLVTTEHSTGSADD